MPVYDYKCERCGAVFEAVVAVTQTPDACPACGAQTCTRLMASPAVHVSRAKNTGGIEKRVKDYLRAGNVADATRFADKAASMVKSDKVKRIAAKLHEKTGK